MDKTYLLTAEEMQRADRATIAEGIPESELMQRAATRLASVIAEQYPPCNTVFVCGKGNNGGDGKIAAGILQKQGWKADIIAADDPEAEVKLQNAELIVDAIFGTGLSKPVEGAYRDTINAINMSRAPVVAVDTPSGINASTGAVLGVAVKASRTVAFAEAKVGHYLMPGKAHTGTLHVVDIGISRKAIEASHPEHLLNTSALWELPEPHLEDHKYSRGAALVMGGQIDSAGAAKLTAYAALKIGAGAVSVLCTAETLPIYAASLMAVMTKRAETMEEFHALIEDKRVTALAIGPGAGVNDQTMARAKAMLATGKPCVIDADALQAELLPFMHARTVITPHTGEFKRLFDVTPSPIGGRSGWEHPSSDGANNAPLLTSPLQGEELPTYSMHHKLSLTKLALQHFPGVLVFKGNDTVIAQRGKPVVINGNAPPTLATAGSGDVLAGIICGLLAQGMEPFDAACAGVWLHADAANRLGAHITAEDLIEVL